jgi:hypothetical protein
MRIMNTRKFRFPVHGLIQMGGLTALAGRLVLSSGLLSGCMSPSPESNPYDGLSCEAKIEKMGRELQAFEAAKKSLAKASAGDTVLSDTTRTPVDSTGKIQLFQGFPPVTGVTGTDTARLGGSEVDSRPIIQKGSEDYRVKWIPPVGFSDSGKSVLPNPLPDSTTPVRETTAPKPLPSDITVVQVISGGKYKAHVRILDYKHDLVREFDQEFGYQGELQNPARVVANGLASYLVWDNRTAAGERPGDGVYLWEVRITLESGLVENMAAKTGLLGDECRPKP